MRRPRLQRSGHTGHVAQFFHTIVFQHDLGTGHRKAPDAAVEASLFIDAKRHRIGEQGFGREQIDVQSLGDDECLGGSIGFIRGRCLKRLERNLVKTGVA